MNIRIADIRTSYDKWQRRGAEFITEPKDHGLLKSINVYCYFIKQKIEEESFFVYDTFLSQYGYN